MASPTLLLLRSRMNRRSFLAAASLAVSGSLKSGSSLGVDAAPMLVEYEVATFSDAEGWLLLVDDDLAGNSDWLAGTLTYDFRQGATLLAIDNRLEYLR